MTRLDQQLAFIIEIDKLKTVLRQTLLMDASRRENSAEHSWHLAVMAMLLTEHAAEPVDVARVMKMLLVHDVVEVDAGDTFAYDPAANVGKHEREQRAADRLFNLLPDEQGREVRALWDEFEARQSAESKYANAIDRLQPLLHNSRTQGGTWRLHGVSKEQVLARMEPVRVGMPQAYAVVQQIVEHAVRAGWIKGA